MAEELGGEEIGEWFPWEDAVDTYESALWEQAHGDAAKAQELLMKAAEADWFEAQYDLGVQLISAWVAGGKSDASLLTQAREWLLKAQRLSDGARVALQEYWPDEAR